MPPLQSPRRAKFVVWQKYPQTQITLSVLFHLGLIDVAVNSRYAAPDRDISTVETALVRHCINFVHAPLCGCSFRLQGSFEAVLER